MGSKNQETESTKNRRLLKNLLARFDPANVPNDPSQGVIVTTAWVPSEKVTGVTIVPVERLKNLVCPPAGSLP